MKLRGLYIVIAVIIVANLAILWMLIPNIPGSFSLLALPIGCRRVLHSLAFSLAALHGLAVGQKIFFWYHFFLVVIPLCGAIGLFLHNDLTRRMLLSIACINSCYWLLLIIRSLWAGFIDYGPALITSLLYIVYLNDRELKSLFKKPIK